jgi:hypothetical protein
VKWRPLAFEAGAASAMRKSKFFANEIQTHAKSGSHPEKPGQNKAKEILAFPSPNRAFSMAYADP